MQLKNYRNQIDKTVNILRQIETVANEMNMKSAVKQVKSIMRRMEGETFHLVIVGEFSRGKSTFVNALLGKKILPASKQPTTAIISKIVYGDTPSYKLYFKQGKSPQKLDEANFIKITAPKQPDEDDEVSIQEYKNAQKLISEIDFAEISYPLSFCKDNVEVVDTPGTNDLDLGRMEITYGYLNQADAVVLILAAYQPLSNSELSFLKERILGNQIQEIFFVISHKDDLDSAEQERDVINFIEEHLKTLLPKDINLRNRIFLVNSLGALYSSMKKSGKELTLKQELKVPDNYNDTGFPDFEYYLGDFLVNEKGMVRLRKHIREIQAIVIAMNRDIVRNIGIISHSADEIRQKYAQMEPKFSQAKRQANQVLSDIKYAFESANSEIEYECHTAANLILFKAKEAVNSLTQNMSPATMQQAIEREVSAEKKRFMDKMLKKWDELFARENERLQNALKIIWNDIEVEYKKNFNLPAVIDNNNSTVLSISESANEEEFSKKAYNFAGEAMREIGKDDSALGKIGLAGIAAVSCAVG
ncbi:MAG: dynamin family protein, partial [Selenomonadaceae bacterium]|nr:dynamin family protein [Selenomonadaceae bacterium]